MYDLKSSRSGRFITSADDPKIPPGIRLRTLSSGAVSYKRWLFPIDWGHLTIRQAYDYLTIVGAPQGKIPEVIRWTEGKDSQLVKQFFYGGVDLRAHDYIHLLLGRGLLPKDEAFVIGFTMGTTNRLVHPDAFQQSSWLIDPADAHRGMDEAIEEVDRALDQSDQPCELDPTTFNQHLESSYQSIQAHLDEQRELARQCFIEINKVLDEANPLAKQDVEQARWDQFYQTALENVDKSRTLVSREVHHASWEGYASERSELRTWIHVLLGRSDSPRDRAFCRGFFHGTSNRRTTYASQLKLDLMRALHISSDGLYSEDMIESYHDGARLGYISDCRTLAEVDFESLHGLTIRDAREKIGLKTALLRNYKSEIEEMRLLL